MVKIPSKNSRMWIQIWINAKIWAIGPWIRSNHSTKFHKDLIIISDPLNRQTEEQTRGENINSLAEAKIGSESGVKSEWVIDGADDHEMNGQGVEWVVLYKFTYRYVIFTVLLFLWVFYFVFYVIVLAVLCCFWRNK